MDLVELKNKALTDIVNILVEGVEGQTLQESEVPLIADFVLKRIAEVKNSVEINILLVDLGHNWQVFENIASLHEGEDLIRADMESAEEFLELARNGQVDDAIDLVKTDL